MKTKLWLICLSAIQAVQLIQTAPLGLFEPYDINIRLRKPGQGHFYVGVLGEKSYDVKAYTTYSTDDCDDEAVIKTNPLQVYEPTQNLISLYQGDDYHNSAFIQLLNSIAGGPGGGVSNAENGLFEPTGKFCVGQAALSTMYAAKHNFYVSGYLPLYFIKLHSVHWRYMGNNDLFSGAEIEQLVQAFQQDAKNLFNLNTCGWKKHGFGDATFLVEWQRDFPQMRPVLKSVQPNLRFGISIPTGCSANENSIMAVPFGADGSVSIPFGGSLDINLADHVDFGFSGQFWYFWDNQKDRRIKTFPTQTSLLFPVVTPVIKKYAFIQNFNLYAQAYSFCKRLSLKFCYQYWRKGEDSLCPVNPQFSSIVANTALQLAERTEHDVFIALTYSPKAKDFKRVFPQAQLFWKGSVKGTRAVLASTAGAQFSVIF